jgi:serine/threonine-protein kinase
MAPDADARFAIARDLPRGTFGRTVVADVLDPALVEEYGARQVVLKIPDDDAEELGSEEFAAAWSVQASNLVRYFSPRKFGGKVVLVMEYVADGDLRDRLRASPRGLPLGEALAIASGVLAGLTAIHERNIVHRDLKPENVVLAGIVPKICDFGLAKLRRGPRASVERYRSTEAYMAPEAIRGAAAGSSPLVDVWAVGVILYEMLTGRRPFDAEEPAETVARILDGRYPPASAINRALPGAVDEVVAGALQREVRSRYRDAAAMQGAVFRLDPGAGPAAAEQHLRRRLAARPTEAGAYEDLAAFFNEATRFSDALRVLTEGVERCPDSPSLHFYKGEAHTKVRQPELALLALERALALGLDPRRQALARRLADAARRRLDTSSRAGEAGTGGMT